jgi:transmembrane protein EpsG
VQMLWATLALCFVTAFMARYVSVTTESWPTGVKPNKLYIMLAALCLMTVAGLRNNIGDTYFYIHSYRVDDFTLTSVLQKSDIGFNLFQMLLKQLSDDPQLLLLTTAGVTNMLIVIVFYRYSRMIEISLYLYITTGAFIVSMNGVRQYLAAAIVFTATHALLEGKWKQYMGIVLLASVFHQSALIMIPIYFLVRRKAWTMTTLIMLGVAIAVVLGFNHFSSMMFSLIKDSQYGHYEDFQEGGANYIRVVVYLVPLFVAFLGREKLRELYPKGDIFVNLAIVGGVLLFISTQNWIIARLGIYFTLYHILLMSWLIKLFRKKDRPLIYFAIIVLYFLYFFYENEIMLNIRYGSDYLKWPF